MSYAVAYRKDKISALMFELLAYSVGAMFACMVLGTVALGVIALNPPTGQSPGV